MDKVKIFFKQFWNNHPIISNVFLIIASLCILCWLTLCFLDLWTHHGDTTRVPNVIGMEYSRAVKTLQAADLKVVISDSVYTRDKPAGSIVDVVPQPDAVVKAGREVYVTIVSFSPEPITIDVLLTDISWKQAEAYLKAKGLKVEKTYVESQYPDVVLDIKCNGRSLALGSNVTIDDTIVLVVGRIPEPVYEEVTDENKLEAAIEAALAADMPEADEPETADSEN